MSKKTTLCISISLSSSSKHLKLQTYRKFHSIQFLIVHTQKTIKVNESRESLIFQNEMKSFAMACLLWVVVGYLF